MNRHSAWSLLSDPPGILFAPRLSRLHGALVLGAMTVATATIPVFGQTAPQLVTVVPADGASGVATNSPIVFTFDQDMNRVFPFATVSTVVGNVTFDPAKLNLFGTWGADKRTLTFKPSVGLPYDTTISWTLNPPGGSTFPQFSSAAGQVLATVSGSFHTAPYVPPPPVPKLVSVTPTNNATRLAYLSGSLRVRPGHGHVDCVAGQRVAFHHWQLRVFRQRHGAIRPRLGRRQTNADVDAFRPISIEHES